MMNQGKTGKILKEEKDELERRRFNNYKQPNQKIVKSKPMDFSKVEPEGVIGQDMYGENMPMDYVQGGTMVSRDWNKPLIDTMNGLEIRAAVTEADFRKRLRLDRARKLT